VVIGGLTPPALKFSPLMDRLKKVKESDLYRLYPTDLLVTGFDIIFFWVARMVLMGTYNMKEKPFDAVYVHGLIRDRYGQKMSKTKGNVVDPLDLIKKYGADALRFGLAAQTVPGSDIKFNEKRIEGYKHFANKIWNASRFVLMNLPEGFEVKDPLQTELDATDRWILHLFNETVKKVREGLERYDLSRSANALYEFFWDYYCDWYIEFTKERIYGGETAQKQVALNTLVFVLDGALKLLHPFMPFLTEEIFDHLPTKRERSISLERYPRPRKEFDAFKDEAQSVEFVRQIIVALRDFKSMLDLPVTKKIKVFYRSKRGELLKRYAPLIVKLARLESFEEVSSRPEGTLVVPVSDGELYPSVEGEIAVKEVLKQQQKRREKILKELKRSEAKLKNPAFLQKAPPAVVEKEREIFNELELELKKVENLIKLLSS